MGREQLVFSAVGHYGDIHRCVIWTSIRHVDVTNGTRAGPIVSKRPRITQSRPSTNHGRGQPLPIHPELVGSKFSGVRRDLRGYGCKRREEKCAYNSARHFRRSHPDQLRKTMKFSATATLPLLLLLLGTRVLANHNESVGDTVCAEGYAMDYYCIERGTLFDNPSIVSLEGPDQHSVMCLIDVPECAAGAYEVLLPPEGGSGNYSRGYQLDNSTKAELFALARSVGVCSSCTGSGTIERGLAIVVQGKVVTAAAGDDPPTITGSVSLSNASSPVCTGEGGPTPGTVLTVLEIPVFVRHENVSHIELAQPRRRLLQRPRPRQPLLRRRK